MVVVVVGNVTGAQGRAIVERFQELQAKQQSIKVTIRGLTRNKHSQKARHLLEGLVNQDLLELYNVDYDDASSFTQAFDGADALLLNVIMSKKESQQYRNMLAAALEAKTIQHIIYSSSTECQLDHGIPHWETSWKTEQYLDTLSSDHPQLTYHVLRYAHCNDNLLTFYKPASDGTMYVPWDPSVKVHTASVRDGARVACKLFLNPTLLPHGHRLDVVTDFCSPHDMAACVSRAKGGATVTAYKGPWILLNVISRLAYEPGSITTMGKFLETHWTKDIVPEPNKIREVLKDEIDAGEPLESVEAFCQRHFGSAEAAPEEAPPLDTSKLDSRQSVPTISHTVWNS